MNSTTSSANNDDNKILLRLKTGDVTIQLLPELAPNHVSRIKELVAQGFYNNLNFHRVIEGFMVQTGDPRGNGTGGSGKNLNAEFSQEPHVRGIVSMARAQNINSADSQFFIVLEDSKFLDGQYTVFGKVIKGMENVDQIKKGDRTNNGMVSNPDKILSMELVKSAS